MQIPLNPKRRESTSRPALKSTWQGPLGKKLTDRLITRRMKEGYYGEEAKKRALSKSKSKGHSTNGFIDRCFCGEIKDVRWCAYKYLETPGFFCPSCLNILRLKAHLKAKTARTTKITIDITEFV